MTRHDHWPQSIPRNRESIPFTLPPEMDQQVRRLTRKEVRTMSEFLGEAIRLCLDKQEWLRQDRRQRA